MNRLQQSLRENCLGPYFEGLSESNKIFMEAVIKNCEKGVRVWLTEKLKEIGDNDEWRAIDLIKELLKDAGAKPFKAYLRCIAPSEACFSCQHIVECRALNTQNKIKGEP